MHVLVVKTSSMGDVIHTLPAIEDAAKAIPGIKFDWLIEESFHEIPAWHNSVDKVIPIALRRWRKSWQKAFLSGEIKLFLKRVREKKYDLIIDAQGLLKSAVPAKLARGTLIGFDKASAREGIAAKFYDHDLTVDKSLHAIERVRRLFARSLGYQYEDTLPSVKLNLNSAKKDKNGVLFLHGTTWPSKHWPDVSWLELGKLLKEEGEAIYLPWATAQEKDRAEWLGKELNASVMPKLSLTEIAELMLKVKAVVGVDTGLTHLAALLDVRSVGIYGSTDVSLTGAMGVKHKNICSSYECSPCLKKACLKLSDELVMPPCYKEIYSQDIFEELGI
jgi:heptosyltransferase-1